MSQTSSYTEGFRRQAVQKMFNRGGKPVSQLAKELGCSLPTLYKWTREMTLQPVEKSTTEWTPKERLKFLNEFSALAEEQKGTWLRQNGLTGELLEEWEDAALDGLSPKRPEVGEGRLKKTIRNLEHQIRRKDHRLQQRDAIIDVQKKVLEMFKDEPDESQELKTDKRFAKE